MMQTPHVAVIGAGPAGLMASETLAASGVRVTVFEAMPTPGRKFLMAGRGGLNLTHSEPFDTFVSRYGEAAARLQPILEAFSPSRLIDWAEDLGQKTFVGSSGRIFPATLKASPLLRAWLARLAAHGVRIETRRRWTGWTQAGDLAFTDEDGGARHVRADATILALGGGSWARLGSDGAWTSLLATRGVAIAPFRPANCGFVVQWSDIFASRFAGAPLKGVALAHEDVSARGEAMIASYGLEGGAVYAITARLRDAIVRDGAARLDIDLRPDLDQETIAQKLAALRPGETLTNRLRRTLNLSPVAIGVLREAHGVSLPAEATALAKCVKTLPVMLHATAPIDRAISTAGGVSFDAIDADLQLRAMPGVFVAGEMLDWEAPTGGYLLQASFATGVAAARGALALLARDRVQGD
ncbi:MAG: TIGR03862 family flavoprotein [Hyphomonadaceae bacterium]|nr:MAG: hypothetical protein FD160_732 [Caulobacteraceae bacterium]MBT9444197.1 TIGR03862 family flavoprotein [Hyphomonadaceae bacterium]TPW06505.1 MAG: hypothetical protein FD124_1682 [Alphaproteobacteria bacterium]